MNRIILLLLVSAICMTSKAGDFVELYIHSKSLSEPTRLATKDGIHYVYYDFFGIKFPEESFRISTLTPTEEFTFGANKDNNRAELNEAYKTAKGLEAAEIYLPDEILHQSSYNDDVPTMKFNLQTGELTIQFGLDEITSELKVVPLEGEITERIDGIRFYFGHDIYFNSFNYADQRLGGRGVGKYEIKGDCLFVPIDEENIKEYYPDYGNTVYFHIPQGIFATEDYKVINIGKTDFNWTWNISTGINGVTCDGEKAAEEYYNMSGCRIEKPTAQGIYIKSEGGKKKKVVIK